MPKTYGYHTGFDKLYNDFCRITNLSNKLLGNEYLSKKIAYKVLQQKKQRIINAISDNKEEILIFHTDKQEHGEFNLSRKTYNIFFANNIHINQ